MKGRKHSRETIEKIRASRLGKKRAFTPQWIENLRKASIAAGCRPPSGLGRKWTPSQRAAHERTHKGKARLSHRGAGNPNWRGGTTSERRIFMESIEYKTWRRHVFQRDDYTCQSCGKRGGELHADHELRYADYPDLRLEVLNGRTLCKKCHLKTDTWGSRSKPSNDPNAYAAAVGKRLGVDYQTFVISNLL